jgi:mRNA interferase MazF
MVIRQGEIYWIDFGGPIGSMPGFERPCVIVQNNIFNASGIVQKAKRLNYDNDKHPPTPKLHPFLAPISPLR